MYICTAHLSLSLRSPRVYYVLTTKMNDIWLYIKLRVTIKKIFHKNAIYSVVFRKKILKSIKKVL